MKTIPLPQTDLHVSSLCLGTANLGIDGDEEAAFRLLDAFVDSGGNFLDSARVYSDWVPGEHGRSERILGDWLSSRGNRSRMVLATKGGHPRLDAMGRSRLSPGELESDLDASLKALRTDAIDLYYLHRDDPALPVDRIVETLASFVRKGKVRWVACSNWTAPRIRAALDHAHARSLPAFAANQMLWNVGVRGMRPGGDPTMVAMDGPLLALHRGTGLPAVPYSSQANGFFTKLERAGGVPDAPLSGSRYCTEGNLALFRAMREVRRGTAVSMASVVLGYLLSQDIPTVPVVGCRTPEQLADTLEAAETRLERETLERLDAAVSGAATRP